MPENRAAWVRLPAFDGRRQRPVNERAL